MNFNIRIIISFHLVSLVGLFSMPLEPREGTLKQRKINKVKINL